MNKKTLQTLSLLGAVLIMGCTDSSTSSKHGALAYRLAGIETASGEESQFVLPPLEKGVAGKYLSSHFAQSRHDWSKANTYLDDIIAADPENEELVRRSMILAVGSGDFESASKRADQLIALNTDDDSLAYLILGIDHMASGRMDEAVASLDEMESGDMTDFITPILKNWAKIDGGTFNQEGFNETTIHHYHAALLGVYLEDFEQVKTYTDALINVGTLSNIDAERAGDLLVLLDREDEALLLYEGVQRQNTTSKDIAQKVSILQKDDKEKAKEEILPLLEPSQIKKPQQGAALTMYDMAYILYQEHSDSSTKLFAQMALALNPELTDAHLLLADTLTRNGRLEDAITQLANVPKGHASYMIVQRHVAELLAEAGRVDEARERLNALFSEHNDVESIIRLGDLYRHEENYKSALTAYNKAAKEIGQDIPEEYWYLLYARGMAYEREGDWGKAESDLKAALGYRPDHPYLLNYLGYGWADQGLNLDESLELIKKAVALRPHDGYIIDSLGWVYFMMGEYEEAIPYLERAVGLLPYDSTINDHLGDAYWRAGRRMEARFQWERALNYNEDDTALAQSLENKLQNGLVLEEPIKQADAE